MNENPIIENPITENPIIENTITEKPFIEKTKVMLSSDQLSDIQEKIGYQFKNAYLLEQAFIRSSYAMETHLHEDNEKLEFVGDKALDFIIVKKMTKHYSYTDTIGSAYENDDSVVVEYESFIFFTHTEGEMTEIKKNIVKKEALANAAKSLGLEKYLFMSKGDISNGVKEGESACEDLIEAIIGAIAIDSDWNIDLLEQSIDKMLSPNHNIENGFDSDIDYMAEFRRWWKFKYGKMGYKFFYEDKGEEAIACSLDLEGFNGTFIEGIGKSKEEAERNFYKRMYDFIKRQEKFEAQMDEIIGKITVDDAVNQLQMLYQKKLIEEPVYTFEKDGIGDDGNPMWQCNCTLEKANKYAIISDKTKALAKKKAAYIVLCQLIGEDFITETINITLIEGEETNEGN